MQMENENIEKKLKIRILAIVCIATCVTGTIIAVYLTQEPAPDLPPKLDLDFNKLKSPQIWNPNSTHDLPYQDYVTPYDSTVKQLSDGITGKLEAYSAAVSWVWVSDMTLNGVGEKWLMPHVFLVDTPNYPTNPAKPREASDCEEQANTLVSVLLAEGIEAENVRVVLGIVDFGRGQGGHAWVEIYEDSRWLALEATSGSYYDDDSRRLVERRGLPYDYYGTHSYPVIEVWFYYNDVYYIDFIHNKENAPSHWSTFQISSSVWTNCDYVVYLPFLFMFLIQCFIPTELKAKSKFCSFAVPASSGFLEL